VHIGFWWGHLSERDYLEDPGIDGTIIQNDLQEGEGGIDWINVAQNGDRWRAVVNTVMNIRVP